MRIHRRNSYEFVDMNKLSIGKRKSHLHDLKVMLSLNRIRRPDEEYCYAQGIRTQKFFDVHASVNECEYLYRNLVCFQIKNRLLAKMR